MKYSPKKAEEVLDFLKEYKGENPYIIWLKNCIFVYKSMNLTDFAIDFIVKNKDYEVKKIDRIVKITPWYGDKVKEFVGIDFTPKVLKITYIIGEMNDSYGCYVFYRQSQEKARLLFIPKKAILSELFPINTDSIEVDFDKYDNLSKNKDIKLKIHQKNGIKFMLASKKCVNADSMGAGKTVQAIITAMESKCKKILVICPASLKTNWKREILNYNDDLDVTIVKGHEWDAAKFTIINYDILDNFYTVPQEIMYETVKDVDENNNIITKQMIKWAKKPKYDSEGNIIESGIPKMKVSRNKDVIDSAMEDSQLFQTKFDFIIIDEAHKLCNNTSTRYKVIKDLLKRSGSEYVLLLTGTPITNRPMNYYSLLQLIGHPITKDYYYYIKEFCNGEKMFLKGEKWKWVSVFLNKNGLSWKEATQNPQISREMDDFLDKNAKYIWKPNGCSNLDELKEKTKNVYIRRLTSDFGDMVKKRIIKKYYDFDKEQQDRYDKIWDEYKRSQDIIKQEDVEKYKAIIEGTILRQFIADEMVSNTIELAEQYLDGDDEQKIVIMCTFDDELNSLKKHFGKTSVTYNGKMTATQKDKAETAFKTDPNVRVFIGNIKASGVGINLEVANVLIFNSFDFVSGNNAQAADRVYRLTQSKDCVIYYQMFNNSFSQEMFDYVLSKQMNIDEIIVKESDK
jgi:SWI/SNF-related matrix-associated actin-dependent regulator 1 of chromatin subfamily A